jgi:proton-dependent oligopeptide transporter, POT family
VVLVFFREPPRDPSLPTQSIANTLRNFVVVASNPRFMLFLLIFSGYWVIFWQQFITLPGYVHGFINANADVEMILITDGLSVIALTLLLNHLMRKIPAFSAIILGTVITSLSWVVLAVHPRVWTCFLAIFVLAIGEIIHQPRYYEYISRLAPHDQQGTYMGFAFVPFGIGSLVGGWFGGRVMHHFAEVTGQPQWAWSVFTGVGLTTALFLFLYDRIVKPSQGSES